MRLALLAVACACGAAWAAVPGLGTSFTVEVRDESRQPVAGVFIVAREFVHVPQFHGSRTYCERADVARVASWPHEVRLPAAGMGHLNPARSFSLEALAYAPGLCIERPPPTSASQEVRLAAKRVAGDEQRLRYLLGLSAVLGCAGADWSPRSREALPQLARAMGAEADAIAKSRYEKSLAGRVRERLAEAARMEPERQDVVPRLASVGATLPFSRDFIVAPGDTSVRWPTGNEPPGTIGLAIAARRGASYGIAAQAQAPGGINAGPGAVVVQMPPPPPPEASRLAIHCRNGPPSACDLDERGPDGRTALSRYSEELNVDAVELLLANGANPSAVVNVRGADSFDALIARLTQRAPAAGSVDAANAVRILEMMAASPKATLRAGLGADLDDAAQWKMPDEAKGVLLLARDRLRALPRRAEAAVACPPVEFDRDLEFQSLPARLRGS